MVFDYCILPKTLSKKYLQKLEYIGIINIGTGSATKVKQQMDYG